jgi:predicted RNA polymerase sigma factor
VADYTDDASVITALDAWPRTGIPDNPRAWLAVVARRKALDLLRRESARAAKETAAIAEGSAWLSEAVARSGGSEVDQRLLQRRLRTVRSELG